MHFTLYTPRAKSPSPAVFIDRDGTINVEKEYLYRIEDWQWIPRAQDAIKLLRNSGFFVVVVSNQSGIARGYYSAKDVFNLHLHMQNEIKKQGGNVDACYWCPHHPDYGVGCHCRKPAISMLMQAVKDLNIDLTRSWMIGDKRIDVQAGLAAGVRCLLVKTGYGAMEMHQVSSEVVVLPSLIEAAQHIKNISSMQE